MTGPSSIAVVKLGSSAITRPSGPDPVLLARSVAQAAAARQAGWGVVLISSGAASLGRVLLRSTAGGRDPGLRLAAAVGQPGLMSMYKFMGDTCGQMVCQVLISEANLASQSHMFSIGELLHDCLGRGILPIINGNDPTDPSGCDNDLVASALAVTCGAAILILLTDVEGVYTSAPTEGGQLLTHLDHESLRRIVSRPQPGGGRGGMTSKLKAASLAAHNGVRTIIASAGREDIIPRALSGELVGSTMPPTAGERPPLRLRWIGGIAAALGTLTVNREAERSLRAGQSLFGSGVKRVKGNFQAGDIVEIVDPSGHLIARGRARVSSQLLTLIRALNPAEVASLMDTILTSFGQRREERPWKAAPAGDQPGWKLRRAVEALGGASLPNHRALAHEIIDLFPGAVIDGLQGSGERSFRATLDSEAARFSLVDNDQLVIFGQRQNERMEIVQ